MTDDPVVARRTATTVSIRVPTDDWPQIANGRATEFRLGMANYEPLSQLPTPMLAVLYRRDRVSGIRDRRLMTFVGVRREKLGAITNDGLRALGYAGPQKEMFKNFRRDWMLRARRRFEPLLPIVVVSVRAFEEGDIAQAGSGLVRWLYAEALDEHVRQG